MSKALGEFYVDRRYKAGVTSSCKACLRPNQRHRDRPNGSYEATIAANRDYIKQYLDAHPCVDCGEADPVVLEFDHVRGTKRAGVMVMVRMSLLDDVKEEVAKCEVRCCNCHRRATIRRLRARSLNFT